MAVDDNEVLSLQLSGLEKLAGRPIDSKIHLSNNEDYIRICDELGNNLPPFETWTPYKPDDPSCNLIYALPLIPNVLIKRYNIEEDFLTEETKQNEWQTIKEDYWRTAKYFAPYLTPTFIFVRTVPNGSEYLSLQNRIEGKQYKVSRDDSIEISSKQRDGLEDFLQRSAHMYLETGKILDIDFFLDLQGDRLIIFDTDQHWDGDWGAYQIQELAKSFNLRVPNELQESLFR